MGADRWEEDLMDAVEGAQEGGPGEPDCRLEALRSLAALARKAPEREVPSDFTRDVMGRIGKFRPPWWRRLWVFLRRPRQVRFNLLGVLSGAGACAFLLLFSLGGLLDRWEPGKGAGVHEAATEYVVRFSYHDPHARQVFVAGSFNNWQKDQIPLVDPSGRGAWVGVVPLRPGNYEYMFVVDGKWMPDQQALRHKDDGFGRRNSVLTLGNGDEKNEI